MLAPPNDSAIHLAEVHKRYGWRGTHALRGVSLTVRRGECFGLLGPNGAGKTTLMKVLMTTLAPTGGQAWLLGQPIGNRAVLSRVGYVPESFEFPAYLTPRRMLHYAGRLAGVRRADRRARIGALLEMVGMSGYADAKMKRFSKGMTQRVALAQGLINQPDLLFLDEPTDGLDPVGRVQFRDMIRGLNRSGMTIFLNSHLLNEVEQVCSRVAVLSAGQVLRVGAPDALLSPAAGLRYSVRVEGPPEAAAGCLAEFRPTARDGAIELDLPDVSHLDAVVDRLRAGRLRILELAPVRASLEAQFLQLLAEPAAPMATAMPVATEVRP